MSNYRFMTMNFQTDLPIYRGNSLFKNRYPSILSIFETYQPDVVGIQELTDEMLNFLGPIQDQYHFYGKARNRVSSFANERNCVLFRKDRFTLLDGKTIWLSSNPTKVGSHDLYSIYPRIATIAHLQDQQTGKSFTFCNTHLDHLTPYERTRQCKVLHQQLMKNNQGQFLVVTGDFNTTIYSSAIQELLGPENPLRLHDALGSIEEPTMRVPQGKLFHKGLPIDHIFVTDACMVKNVHICKDHPNGIYPSDHYPVVCDLTTQKEIL